MLKEKIRNGALYFKQINKRQSKYRYNSKGLSLMLSYKKWIRKARSEPSTDFTKTIFQTFREFHNEKNNAGE